MKTYTAREIPALQNALYSPDTLYENVFPTADGKNLELKSEQFSNARAIFRRAHIQNANRESTNVERLDIWIGITRNSFFPRILLLDTRQAIRLYASGPCVKTSAVTGGHEEPIHVTGFNPFIVNDPHKDVAMFRRLVEQGVKVILVNTGYYEGRKITQTETQAALSWYFRSEDPMAACFPLADGVFMRESDRDAHSNFSELEKAYQQWDQEETSYLQTHPVFSHHPELFL